MDLKSEKEFLRDFIELYKSCPCLWKVKSPEYSNKRLKNQCYEEMVKLLQTVQANANKDSVCRKIRGIRCSFRKELRKVNASKKTFTCPELIYKPQLWYFDKLMFLVDQETESDGETTAEAPGEHQGKTESAELNKPSKRPSVEPVSEAELKSAKEFQKDFIELYKSFPCLWNVNSPDCLNRRLKNECYEELLKLLQTVEPNATKYTVMKKINDIQSSFRAELRKVIISKKLTPDHIYQPILWYFDSLMFLCGQDTYNDGDTIDRIYDDEEGIDGDLCGDGTAVEELEVSTNPPPLESEHSTPTNSDHNMDFSREQQEIRGGMYAHLGEYIAKSLEDIKSKSPETCSIVRKLICDAIFEGESGTLRNESQIVTQSDGHLIIHIPASLQAEAVHPPLLNGPAIDPQVVNGPVIDPQVVNGPVIDPQVVSGPVIASQEATPWRCNIDPPDATYTTIIDKVQSPTQSYIEL